MNLIELQNKIHQQNKEVGWWDNPRPFHTMICLINSENAEAMEGDRKNLMDDHLPQYPMFHVELADFVIRCLDYLGSVNYNWETTFVYDLEENVPTCLLAELIQYCGNAYWCHKEGLFSYLEDSLGEAVIYCVQYSLVNKIDLFKIIDEKVAYNKTRADHKRENRAKAGGKKY